MDNPYESSERESVGSDSSLSRFEIKVLEFYSEHRTADPRIWIQLAKYIPSWLLIAAVTGVPVILIPLAFDAPINSGTAQLAAGILFGVIIRDYGNLRRSLSAWPLIRKVVNFDRVDELLLEHR